MPKDSNVKCEVFGGYVCARNVYGSNVVWERVDIGQDIVSTHEICSWFETDQSKNLLCCVHYSVIG